MAERNIDWTKTADIQFIGILEYWVHRNKSNRYSLKLLRLVSERVNKIVRSPELYKKCGFKDLRVSILKSYSIYYSTTKEQLIIWAFWDNRQNPEKLLQALLNKKA